MGKLHQIKEILKRPIKPNFSPSENGENSKKSRTHAKGPSKKPSGFSLKTDLTCLFMSDYFSKYREAEWCVF